jgi:hypothetical protein
MTEETAPPTSLPPAAEPPYPRHPAPHGATYTIPVAKRAKPPFAGLGGLGVTLIGGALAATIGLLAAIPFFKRRKTAKKAAKTAPSRSRAARAPRKTG